MPDHFEIVERFWERDRQDLDKLRGNLVVAWVCVGILATALLFVLCWWGTGGK